MTPAEEVKWGGEKTRMEGQPFLPTYVYDAMKVKKRFEHMRVSFPLFFSSSILMSFLLSSLLFLFFRFLFF